MSHKVTPAQATFEIVWMMVAMTDAPYWADETREKVFERLRPEFSAQYTSRDLSILSLHAQRQVADYLQLPPWNE